MQAADVSDGGSPMNGASSVYRLANTITSAVAGMFDPHAAEAGANLSKPNG
jgi:hypothetical protein